MKNAFFFLCFLFQCVFLFAEERSYQLLSTDELKTLVDSNYPMILVDCRLKHHDDGHHLPLSIVLPYNSSSKAISRALPSKEQMIVIYCNNESCPASRFLAHRLVHMHYKHVYKYLNGLDDWINRGYPIEKPHS